MAAPKKKVIKQHITRIRKRNNLKSAGADTLKYRYYKFKKDALAIQKELRNEWN